MALVVLLRGVNVGGHKTFRPTELARQLEHLDAVNIGAAGTFVIRRPTTQAKLRAEIGRRLPFDAEIIICKGRDVADLVSRDFFASQAVPSSCIRFVSVLAGKSSVTPSLPMSFPPKGKWLLKVLARQDRFIVGLHRREMRALNCLGMLDRIFGVPVTTRNWNTIAAIGRVLAEAVA